LKTLQAWQILNSEFGEKLTAKVSENFVEKIMGDYKETARRLYIFF
jgi:hypothetical protein